MRARERDWVSNTREFLEWVSSRHVRLLDLVLVMLGSSVARLVRMRTECEWPMPWGSEQMRVIFGWHNFLPGVVVGKFVGNQEPTGVSSFSSGLWWFSYSSNLNLLHAWVMLQCGPSTLLSGIHYRLPPLNKGYVRFGGSFTNGSLTKTLSGEIEVCSIDATVMIV